MPRIGNTEWLYVLKQSNTQAKCAFCKQWHVIGGDSEPGHPPGCSAAYARSRQVAITIRTLDGGRPRKPRKAEVTAAIKHAWSRR